jgi:regulator of protease activity HflC (stomatin/prohibitin superfamily)
MTQTIIIIFAVIVIFNLFIRIVKEYQRAVIFRFGRCLPNVKGPGLIFVWPVIDDVNIVDLRVVALDVPPQDIITKDNVSAKVNAVVYFRVLDPIKALNEVQNFQYATSQLAQTTLRSVIGEADLDDLLSQREQLNHRLQTILDKQTDPWGIKVSNVEIKHVDISEELRRSMARQAEAEREKRAKIIAADGEFQAAAKLLEAAQMMEKSPLTLQLRYLQTLVEIGSDKNTTTIFPVPMDFLDVFKKLGSK